MIIMEIMYSTVDDLLLIREGRPVMRTGSTFLDLQTKTKD